MNHQFKLVTSNEKKLREYQQFGLNLQIEKGRDLPEIQSEDPVLVVLHKAKDAGPMHVVEDTSLDVEGFNVGVNVRWLMSEIPKLSGKRATWTVLLGKNDGTSVHVYSGTITGNLVANEQGGFGFDPYFVPDGSTITLSELEARGGKDDFRFSARKKAAHNLLEDRAIFRQALEDVGEWSGPYQSG